MTDSAPAPTGSLSATSMLLTEMSAPMDPRLQRLLVQRRLGLVKVADVSTAPDEVAVLARVTDVSQWEALSEVRIGSTIGESADGTVVVTARIPVTRIEPVRLQPFVTSLKAAQPLRSMLDATLAETAVRPDLLPTAAQADGGAGVVVGIVDYGCDFVHQNFRTAGGGTRLLCLWDQNGATTPDSPFGYGRKYTRADINQALEELDPYDAFGVWSGPRCSWRPPRDAWDPRNGYCGRQWAGVKSSWCGPAS